MYIYLKCKTSKTITAIYGPYVPTLNECYVRMHEKYNCHCMLRQLREFYDNETYLTGYVKLLEWSV